jgi:hypothetical protein
MPGAVRRSPRWARLSLVAACLVLAGTAAWYVWFRPQDRPSPAPGPIAQQPPPHVTANARRRIRLFFPQEAGESLKEQEREIRRGSALAEEVRAVLQALTSSPEPGIRPPLPPGIELRQVFLDAFGIAYLDLSKGIQAVAARPGGQAELAISAIVNTLTTNFSEIKRVQFLVEGQEVTIMAGDVDLRRPAGPRFPGEEVRPVVSQPEE